jgi:predicted Fe-Mo cluster-binding NifX family protein
MKKVISIVMLLMSVLSIPVFAGQGLKIAVASNDRNPGSPVADRMGRSPFYLLFDWQGNFIEAVENPNFGKGPGASGTSAIDSIGFDEKGAMTGGIPTPSREERDRTWTEFRDFFVRTGIGVVVAEVFGDEIVRGMKARGIECVAFKGSSDDAVRSMVKGVRNGASKDTEACKEGDESCTTATRSSGSLFRPAIMKGDK